MLSIYDNEQYVFEALKAGASGYALKSVADQDLLNACHAAVRGELLIDPGVMSALMRSHLDRLRRGEPSRDQRAHRPEGPGGQAHRRGSPSRAIANMLTMRPKTVEHHQAQILQKLGMRDRPELTGYAIRAGLIEP
jgi:DNA-binding NarL/FixJ family response regulator